MSEQAPIGGSPPMFPEALSEGFHSPYRYRPLNGLTNAVLGVGALKCLAALVVGVALAHQWRLLIQIGGHMFPSHEGMTSAANANDRAVTAARRVFLVSMVVSYVLGGMWIYRAASNVRARGARRLTITPGWAVGWYFVPLAALVRPFEAMVEIWNASLSPERWRVLPVPGLLRVWWGFWISVGLFGYISAAIVRMGTAIPNLILGTQSGIVSAVIDIVTNGLFLTIVWRITRLQKNAPASASQTAAVFG